MTTIVDTDKSGHGFQKQKVWLGPSLGWSEEYVQPSTLITSGTIYAVEPGDGMLLLDVPNPITILLPDVRKWFQQVADQPATGWNRQICIKDFSGLASTNNITVQTFGTQRIDKNIGPATINVNNAVFLLVPNVDLTGWIIAAGSTTVLIPVGTYLPVHDPHATGILRVGDPGGDIAAISGLAAGQQGVIYGVDPSSVDAAVNIHLIPKGVGGVNLYSNGALQLAISGPTNVTDYLVISGASGLADPIIANAGGGPIRIDDEILVGPPGGNFAGLQGSANGQMSVAVRADNVTNPDATINITLVPNGAGGCAFWSNGSLQAFVSGPAACTHFLQFSGSVAGNPLIQAAFTTYLDVLNANLTGVPTCPTAPLGTNTQQVASTAFVLANAGSGGGGLPLTGGTLTGDLTIQKTSPSLILFKTNSSSNSIWGSTGPAAATAKRWELQLGDQTTESLGNVGSNFALRRYDDAGVIIDSVFTIQRNSGFAAMTGPLTVVNTLYLGSAAANPGGGSALAINGFTSPLTGINIYNWANDASDGRIVFGKSRGGVVGNQGSVVLGDRLMDMSALGSDGVSFQASAAFACIVDSAPILGRVPSYFVFSNTDRFGGGLLQRMKIDSAGIVYVGQGPFPVAVSGGLLQIDSTTGGASAITVSNFQAAAGSAFLNLRHSRGTLGNYGALLLGDPMGTLQFYGSDASAWILGAQIGAVAHLAPSGGRIPTRLSFNTENGTNLTERMRLFPSGGLSVVQTGGFAVDPGAGGIIADSFIGSLIGVTTNSNAAAGQVGEQIQSIVQAAVSLGAPAAQTVITTIPLTAGDWDVSTMVTIQATTTAGGVEVGVSTTGALTGAYDAYLTSYISIVGSTISASIPCARFSLAAPATVSLVARSGVAGMTGTAVLRARRVR